MRIVFVYSGAENLGIEYISSVLKLKGHEVYLIFDPAIFSGDTLINNQLFSRLLNVDKKIVNSTITLNPDLVGFSAYTGNYQWCLNIALKIKAISNTPIVFGGVHATAVPERILADGGADFVIIGEGEYAMLDLVEHLQNSNGIRSLLNTSNICFRYENKLQIAPPRPYIQNLDDLPFPDKTLFYNKVPLFEELYSIATSRGCPYNCTYCSNDMYHKIYCHEKKHVRRRSPDNVIEEILLFKNRGKIKLVSFVDDVFTFSKSWLEEFIPKYKSKINIPFWCSVHPLSVTEEKAKLLKEGGCWLVTMGIQHGSERIRTEVFNRKGANDEIIESVSHLKNAGLKVSVDNIFGAPGETEEDLIACFDLYKRLKTDRMLTFWLTYYPKTSIIVYAENHNCLSHKEIENIEKGYTGTTIKTGSVSKEKAGLYYKYELLFHLRCLFHNDTLFNIVSKMVAFTPFKRLLSRIVIVLCAIVNRDQKFLHLLKYIWVKKNTP